MFKSRTTFVVGAGASAELGLPIGAAIKPLIAKKLDIRFQYGSDQKTGDRKIMEALRVQARENGEDVNEYIYAGRRIATGMHIAPSIDNFIDAHQEDEKVVVSGKLGIASAILDAERSSRLYYKYQERKRPDISTVADTWLPAFASKLVEGVAYKNIESIFSNVSFVTFNYDRCIESYLYFALQDYYGIDERRAANLVGGLRISHPYGQVGKLPWQSIPDDQIPFGADLSGTSLLKVSRRIRTFTERIDEQSDLAQIKSQMSSAETVVFLGFSFQDQNMALLAVASPSDVKRVFSTALGFSGSDCSVISNVIRRALMSDGVSVELRKELSCAQLFGEYSKSIAQ